MAEHDHLGIDEEAAAAGREQMVAAQIAARGLTTPRLLAAFRSVRREAFVPSDLRDRAFTDGPLPIGHGQTISQPYVVALMLNAARLGPEDRVLDVGTGSGYAAAILAHLARAVFSVERQPDLALSAATRLRELGYDNVTVREGDGTLGWPEAAPFDAVLVAAGGPEIPPPLLAQLAPGGRLIMPLGDDVDHQRLIRAVRGRNGRVREEDLGPVAFVPLLGVHGFR